MGKQSFLLEGPSQDLSELSQINSCGAVLRLKPRASVCIRQLFHHCALPLVPE